jgi:hypothetical protein
VLLLNANNLEAALGGRVDEGNAAGVGSINGQGRNGKSCGSKSARLQSVSGLVMPAVCQPTRIMMGSSQRDYAEYVEGV